MEFDYKPVLGTIAVIVTVVSYVPYFNNLLRGKTKPHAFSWLVWGVLNAIAFAGQIHDNGGPGTWSVGLSALAMFVIFGISLQRGEKDIRPFDWFCLGGASFALTPWLLTNDPLLSVILVTIIDALGFLPTVRKSFNKPHQEALTTFVLSTIKYLMVVLALQNYTVVTVLFPFAVFVMNALFVAMLLVRRRQVGFEGQSLHVIT